MKNTLQFLENLAQNNHREWFSAHKTEWESINKKNKLFFENIFQALQKNDFLDSVQQPRIYRNLRFSKDKTPFKTYSGAKISRLKPFYRGSYFIHIEPNQSFVAGGFWAPNPEDLHRIRKEFEADFSPMHEILSEPFCQQYFEKIKGEDAVKTAPKGFDKNHSAIESIRKKQFLLKREFSNEEVCDGNFSAEILKTCLALRPFLDYMTEILTTDLNGEPLF